MSCDKIVICLSSDTVYKLIKEYFQSWAKQAVNSLILLPKKDYYSLRPKNLPTECDVLLFTQHIPEQIFLSIKKKKLKTRCAVLNVEQPSRSSVVKQMKAYRQHGVTVLDYSRIGANLTEGVFMPYCYNAVEVNRMEGLRRDFEWDVVVCNLKQGRRMDIYNSFKDITGLRVTEMRGWGDDRDRITMNGKVFVNIHFNDKYKTYESLRCDRILFAGKIVLTEESDEIPEDLSDLLVVSSYDDIIKNTLKILDDFDNFHTNYRKKYKQSISDITKGRVEQAHLATNTLKGIECDTPNESVTGLVRSS